MKIRWFFIIICLALIVSSCIHKPVSQSTEQIEQKEFALGYRPLPKEFLDWWFNNLEKIKNGEIDPVVFEGSSDSKLLVKGSQIAQTQIPFTQPEIDALPPSYLAPHTKPKDQGQNGTCWAFATAGALESALLTQLSPSERSSIYPFLDPDNPDLSEQFIAYYNVNFYYEYTIGKITLQETNEDIGGDPFFSTFFNLIRRGVTTEGNFPYIKEEQGWIKWNPTGNNWKTQLVRSYKTVCIPNFYIHETFCKDYTAYINTIKSAIMKYGALAVAFTVYSDFGNYWFGNSGKVYQRDPNYFQEEGHAVLLVGWVDNYVDSSGYQGPIWVLKNSWGTDGGFSLNDYGLSSDTTKGYFALPMLTEDEYNNEQGVYWKVECNEMYVPLVESTQSKYTIVAEDQIYTYPRLNYIDVRVVDESGFPVSGVKVKMAFSSYSGGMWAPVFDELTWEDVFVTDENGHIEVAFFGYMPGSYQIKAYLYDQPEISKEFTVTLQPASHNFLVWMCADNDLENYAIKDLDEMKNTNNNVAMFVMFDGKIQEDKLLVLDEYGEWKNALDFRSLNISNNPFSTMTEFDSGDPDFLKMILELAFNANRGPWFLVLWDHGGAWVGDSKNLSSTYTPKAICFDETSGNSISTAELRTVLEELAYQNRKVDLLAMDACLMGSIEVLYELKGLVDYVVASSFSVPGDGYNYSFLKQITPTDDALSVGEKIVDAYKQYYDNTPWESYGLSLAVYDMSRVQDVTSQINSLGYRLVEIMNDTLRSTIDNFYSSLTQYEDNVLVDLNDCAYRMQSIDDSDVQNYAQQIQDYLDQLVVYEYVEKTGCVINNPVSIFMPNDPGVVIALANDYNTLLFTKELFWSNFLESWLQTGDVLEYVPTEFVPKNKSVNQFLQNVLSFPK